MDNDKLYIPYGLNVEQEYFAGFGRTELIHCVIGCISFAAVGALLLLITGEFLALVVTLIIGAAGSFMMTKRDTVTRTSVIGQVANMVRFFKSQKHYNYVYKSRWDTN
ncbi:MAG: hypothetical protein ACI4JS_06325 [Oscillospiraceae bacterium]